MCAVEVGFLDECGMGESCGRNDLHGVLRLPLQHYSGNRGFDDRDASQALNSVYDMLVTLKPLEGACQDVMDAIWKHLERALEIHQQNFLRSCLDESLFGRVL